LRLSAHAYNEEADYRRLADMVETVLAQTSRLPPASSTSR
jgi:hypothetical protein